MAIDEVIGVLSGSPARSSGVALGSLAAVHEDGTALVIREGAEGPAAVRARSLIVLTPEDAGREVLLALIDDDPSRPVILGLLQGGPKRQSVRVEADGDRIVIRGEQEVVLQCGKASITMTRAGKILIRGAYVLSRSSGVNRVKGGSVQIN